jgi:transposase
MGNVGLQQRRALVATLYPSHSTTELAARFDVSNVTIRNDLRALGIEIRQRGLTVGQRRRAVRMRRAGKSLRTIARALGCNYGTLCTYLASRDVPRLPSNRDFGPTGELGVGKLTLGRAEKRFAIARSYLREACDDGRIRGERIEGAGSRGVVYLFDPQELEEDLRRWPCRVEGCDRPALGESGGCFEHGRALATRGRPLTDEHRERVSEALKGKPRPYARELRLRDWSTDRPKMIRAQASYRAKDLGDTRMFGRHSKLLAEAKGERSDAKRPHNQVGRASPVRDDPEILRRIRELRERNHSQQRIAYSVSNEFGIDVSRDQVKRALKAG